MAQEFRQGDRVKWNTPQGETYGKVKKKLTSSTEVGGQKLSSAAFVAVAWISAAPKPTLTL